MCIRDSSHRIQGLTEVQLHLSEKEMIRKLPPLLKGYRWMGAEIGGEPAYDPIFDSIDFLIILEKERIAQKYQRRFFIE
jgi:putative hemolysin